MMKTIKKYEAFNFRRYGNPWVAIVSKTTGKIDFTQKVGGYTGGYKSGDAGELYVIAPKEGDVYAYGQKDYRGNGTEMEYVQYIRGDFVLVEKTDLISRLNG